MKKYSANYSYCNHNFVIQNLKGKRINNEYLPAICIIKNILQRGKPTLLSAFLQSQLGSIHKEVYFNIPCALIDKGTPTWQRIIRGDEKKNYYPAKKFYETLIPKYLPEYRFIQQLIIPEIPVNTITQTDIDEFANNQVDFYLPQAYLIIEIDGLQHEIDKDRERDSYTAKYGIQTIRISTRDLEAENDVFLKSIEQIKKRIKKIFLEQDKRRETDNTFIALENYRTSFENNIDLSSSNLKATAIIRFQILILELLENGLIHFNSPWCFEVFEQDIKDFAQLAIDDLLIWFENIFKLHKIEFEIPQVEISNIASNKEFSLKSGIIKIDFSLLKRYTDEFQVQPDIIFVRTDYLDEYLYFKKGDSTDKLIFSSFEAYDYFKIASTIPIKYNLKFGGKNTDEKALLFFLWNIFLQNDPGLSFDTLRFREGQLSIITNSLSKNDTIGLLPTGTGKSVCYQLSAILQPAISFVVCPIKSLMYDQKADLDSAYFSRTNHITSEDDEEDKEKIQREFGQGKYFFIFISPERFQIKTFRQYFSSVNKNFNIAYAIIDEVHCLSEWGHDFRTSYLNLSNTIQRLCANFNFLGLTATASLNVLKDIRIEFGIKEENIKTPVNYTRKELEFIVIDDQNQKLKTVNKTLAFLKETIGALEENEADTKCGIIFTPTVRGGNGCYLLAQNLSNYWKKDIRYYSGSIPKIDGYPIMSEAEFIKYKNRVQTDFKKNKFSLLTATKSFGMGVNKGNIYYTFHYGIPGSMESLYQEAGRAGRDKNKFLKNKAKCFVLLSKTNDESLLPRIWDSRTTLTQIEKLQKQVSGDINTNLFLFTLSLDIISVEFEIIRKLYSIFSQPNKKGIVVKGQIIGYNKAQTEKAIYRLNQLGIIEDWTINNFFGGGSFEVDFSNYNEESIKESLFNVIRKYNQEFSYDIIKSNDKYLIYKKILFEAPRNYSMIDRYILILLQWSYDNFAYNRRQSLKTIYENCCGFVDGNISSKEFQVRLEDYFKFTQSSFLLQHIADNPVEFEHWFEVFYQLDKNVVTNRFITKRQQESLRNNLDRFLESYMYNTGLDLISGLLRLLLDDYKNAHGEKRLESSLEQISQYDHSQIDFILQRILKIGIELSNSNKENLAKSLYKYFNNQYFLKLISKSLGDNYSTEILLKSYTNNRLRIINEKYLMNLDQLNEKLKKQKLGNNN